MSNIKIFFIISPLLPKERKYISKVLVFHQVENRKKIKFK